MQTKAAILPEYWSLMIFKLFQCKKFNETAQTANFTYFPLILYAKLCKRKR